MPGNEEGITLLPQKEGAEHPLQGWVHSLSQLGASAATAYILSC